MEFEGVVFKVLPAVKGTSARGEWTKQEVVFDQPGEFSRKVCVSFWGDKAQDAAAYQPGAVMMVSINMESREFNGRWFTEIRAWKATPKMAEQTAPSAMSSSDFPPIDGGAPQGTYSNDPIDDIPF